LGLPDRGTFELLGAAETEQWLRWGRRRLIFIGHATSPLGGGVSHSGLGADQPLGAGALSFHSFIWPSATAPPCPQAARRGAHVRGPGLEGVPLLGLITVLVIDLVQAGLSVPDAELGDMRRNLQA